MLRLQHLLAEIHTRDLQLSGTRAGKSKGGQYSLAELQAQDPSFQGHRHGI
jgi:hypothetical protein